MASQTCNNVTSEMIALAETSVTICAINAGQYRINEGSLYVRWTDGLFSGFEFEINAADFEPSDMDIEEFLGISQKKQV